MRLPVLTLSTTLLGCTQPAFDPTLANIQAEVFTQSCSIGSSCHSSSGMAGELDLGEGISHGSLVDVPSAEVDGWTRVVPGDPDSSLLVAALRGPVSDVRQMPPGWELDAEVILAIEQWIEVGASAD